ncbi:MAG TPA: hypothetical protein VGR62_09035 [Candidatus Binatia bacterium]|jgi:hypothetical protein|nr:hypothetical protein [Candidatus Binatia bacterium]
MGIVALDGPPPDALVAFLDASVTPRGPAHWRWKYANGTPDRPSGFYHQTDDGAVTGFIGLMSTTLHLAAGPVAAAWLVDWVSAESQGAIGVGVGLLRKAEAATPLRLTLGGSAVARDIYTKLRWGQVPGAGVWVLRLSARNLATRGPMRRWPVLRPAARLAGSVARLWWRVPTPRHTGLTLRAAERVPPSYDAVWEARRAEFAPVMDRGSAELNRKFADYPTGGYRILLVEHGGRTVGHVVVRSDETHGFRRGRIVDLLWPRGDAVMAVALVHEAAWLLQEAGVDYIECTASVPELDAALRARRFTRVQTLPLFYRRPPKEVGEPQGWYVTYLDCDRAYR